MIVINTATFNMAVQASERTHTHTPLTGMFLCTCTCMRGKHLRDEDLLGNYDSRRPGTSNAGQPRHVTGCPGTSAVTV